MLKNYERREWLERESPEAGLATDKIKEGVSKILSIGKWKIVIVPSLARLEQIRYGEEVRNTSSKGRLVFDQKNLEVLRKRICI